MITVTIREIHGPRPGEWVSRHRTQDRHEAFARALRRHWGRSAAWWPSRDRNDPSDGVVILSSPGESGGPTLTGPCVVYFEEVA